MDHGSGELKDGEARSGKGYSPPATGTNVVDQGAG
jgi:hypothetical protein